MSGAAALAAAKRRRGESTLEDNVIQAGANSSTPRRGRMSAIQLLKLHDAKIVALEKERETVSLQDLPEIALIQERLTELEKNHAVPKQNGTSDSGEDIKTLKDRIKMLENKLLTMSETMNKIQTYAMETSMSVMKLKNSISSDEQNINMHVKEHASNKVEETAAVVEASETEMKSLVE